MSQEPCRAKARWRFHGTNTGSVEGNPATGREVSVSGFHLYRIVDGRIAEVWAQPDVFGFMYQLGLLPAMTAEVA
jgi:predicted ester cyclase